MNYSLSRNIILNVYQNRDHFLLSGNLVEVEAEICIMPKFLNENYIDCYENLKCTIQQVSTWQVFF